MRMPFVRQALDADTQRPRRRTPWIVDLEYKLTFEEDFSDLTAWTVVEETVGNVSVSGNVLTIICTSNGYGKNGIWRSRTPAKAFGEIRFRCRETGTVNTRLSAGLFDGAGFAPSINGFYPNIYNTLSRSHLRANHDGSNANMGSNVWAIDTWQSLVLLVDGVTCIGDGIIKYSYFLDDQYIESSAGTASVPPTDTAANIQNGNVASTCSVSDYSEHFGGFEDTATPTVDYVADAGDGKKWHNFKLTNADFDYSLTSPNARFRYYYGDDVSPIWGSELTLAQLQAVGDLTDQYRYAMIRVEQNSDGDTQCPVTEVNALDMTEGQAAGGGSGTKSRFASPLGIKGGFR